MIKESIATLVSGKSLTKDEAAAVMEEIMEGKATPSQLGAFLTALAIKGETADEIAGLAGVMRDKAVRVTVNEPVLDIVGTGGDGSGTFNISTAAALVAAGAGIKVAKHGNRAASSQAGAADVLETLGVKIDLTAEGVKRCIEEAGFGFMFAPAFHPAMKHAAPTRRELGIRTVFNILGPLTNPAHAGHMVLGVPSEELGLKMTSALIQMGIRHGMVVHSLNGWDEISITGRTMVREISTEDETLPCSFYHVSPEELGLKRASGKTVKGGTAADNAGIIRSILSGEKSPRRDVVVMNAAAGITVASTDKLGGMSAIKENVRVAEESIDSGSALKTLEKLIEVSQKVANLR